MKKPQYESQKTLGKLPPQAIDLEEAVLGALMLEKGALINVTSVLTEESFYNDAHQKIFKAILSLHSKSNPIDILTVTAELKLLGDLESIGGAYYITELTNRVAGSANIEFHARIIQQKFIQRELIKLSSTLINQSYDDTNDIFDILEFASFSLYDLNSGNLGKDFVEFNTLIDDRYRVYCQQKSSSLTGVGTMLNELDSLTNGFQNNNLIILAARPAMGKTAMALHFIRKAAFEQNLPVAIFSLEMSKEQLTDRILAAECEVELDALKKRNLKDWHKHNIEKESNRLFESNIIIDESSTLTINQLKSKAIRMQEKHGIKMIVVDYLQLMSGSSKKSGNREQEISEISRGLKQVAKDLNIPVIALSQLSRAVETRAGGSKRPMLSDLRESGSIEQDADIVMFLYRPEYYGIEQDENGNSTNGLTEIIVAKNRDGEVDIARCKFIGKFQKFVNESDLYQTEENLMIDASPNPLNASDYFN